MPLRHDRDNATILRVCFVSVEENFMELTIKDWVIEKMVVIERN